MAEESMVDDCSCPCGTPIHLPGFGGFDGRWIQCDRCDTWWHRKCAGVAIANMDNPFICCTEAPRLTAKFKQSDIDGAKSDFSCMEIFAQVHAGSLCKEK